MGSFTYPTIIRTTRAIPKVMPLVVISVLTRRQKSYKRKQDRQVHLENPRLTGRPASWETETSKLGTELEGAIADTRCRTGKEQSTQKEGRKFTC